MLRVEQLQGWLPDPSGRHQFRHYSAAGPTTWVSDGGQAFEDPMEPAPEVLAPPAASDRPVGWYRNASNPEVVRFWDGAAWTDGPAETQEVSQRSIDQSAGGSQESLLVQPSSNEDGWDSDPLGRFRFRWISSGVPTRMVCDAAGQVSFDDPAEPYDQLTSSADQALTRSSEGPTTDSIPAEWYSDPSDRTRLRYWDGSGWTNHVHDERPS
jgi:Protein of unknown function (DUF2510)